MHLQLQAPHLTAMQDARLFLALPRHNSNPGAAWPLFSPARRHRLHRIRAHTAVAGRCRVHCATHLSGATAAAWLKGAKSMDTATAHGALAAEEGAIPHGAAMAKVADATAKRPPGPLHMATATAAAAAAPEPMTGSLPCATTAARPATCPATARLPGAPAAAAASRVAAARSAATAAGPGRPRRRRGDAATAAGWCRRRAALWRQTLRPRSCGRRLHIPRASSASSGS